MLLAMGTANDRAFEKKARRILRNLGVASTFEEGQRELGEILGLRPGNAESDAAPDPWWLGDTLGIVFEDHADGNPETVFGANKAKQAAGHPAWIRENVPGGKDLELVSVLVTPCTTAGVGGQPVLREVLYWELEAFRVWAKEAVHIVRELKATLPPHSDLFWREEAAARMQAAGLTLCGIISTLKPAADAMTFVGK